MSFAIFELLLIFICLVFLNYILKYKKILLDNPEHSNHKLKINLGIPLSGGLFIFFTLIYSYFYNYISLDFLFLSLSILILGIVADVKKNFSVKIRFIFQLIILILFITINDLKIPTLGSEILDKILLYSYLNQIFVLFCLITLLNGLNFIDGANGLSSGYFLLINSFIYLLITKLPNVSENIINLNIIIIKVYFIFFLFNIFGKCFFGDNGIYVSLIINSYLLINLFVLNYNYFSPYFIASLLWYPAFENLFTILRRLKDKKKLISPDNQHLHYLLMMKLKKFNFFKKKGKIFLNSLTGITTNLILVPGFVFSLHYYNNSLYLLLNICAYVILYILTYIFLYKKNLNVNENFNL